MKNLIDRALSWLGAVVLSGVALLALYGAVNWFNNSVNQEVETYSTALDLRVESEDDGLSPLLETIEWKGLAPPGVARWRDVGFETDAGDTGLLRLTLACTPNVNDIVAWMGAVKRQVEAALGQDEVLFLVDWYDKTEPRVLYVTSLQVGPADLAELADIMDGLASILCSTDFDT